MSEEQQQKYLLFMQNLETIGFIVKETMSLDQLLLNLEKIYSRDLQGLENNKIEALSKVIHEFKECHNICCPI